MSYNETTQQGDIMKDKIKKFKDEHNEFLNGVLLGAGIATTTVAVIALKAMASQKIVGGSLYKGEDGEVNHVVLYKVNGKSLTFEYAPNVK